MSMQWIGDYLSLTTRLREARRASGMTQLQAARLLGISERTFRGWEAGEAEISATGLFLLAHRLGGRVYDPAAAAMPPVPGLCCATVDLHDFNTHSQEPVHGTR